MSYASALSTSPPILQEYPLPVAAMQKATSVTISPLSPPSIGMMFFRRVQSRRSFHGVSGSSLVIHSSYLLHGADFPLSTQPIGSVPVADAICVVILENHYVGRGNAVGPKLAADNALGNLDGLTGKCFAFGRTL